LPSDLCLMLSDGEAWLVNLAADEESHFVISTEEAAELDEVMPELGLRRFYPKH
jgi:hypothetical protein